MVSKAKSIKGSASSVEYIQNDKELGDAVELARNGVVSNEPNEIMKEFRIMQEANARCEKNTISIVISPSNEKKFSIPELREIGKRHLKELGLEKNQYLMTLHQSTGKPHIHILANRIDEQGKALNDSFISKKCQTISENLAKEMNLLTAKDWKKINELTLQPVKAEIKKTHEYAVSKAHNYEDYKDLMRGKGVTVIDSINKKGELQGFKFHHKQSDLTFKSSEIGKNFGAKNLLSNRIEMPISLSPPLQKIALRIIKEVARTASRGMGY